MKKNSGLILFPFSLEFQSRMSNHCRLGVNEQRRGISRANGTYSSSSSLEAVARPVSSLAKGMSPCDCFFFFFPVVALAMRWPTYFSPVRYAPSRTENITVKPTDCKCQEHDSFTEFLASGGDVGLTK